MKNPQKGSITISLFIIMAILVVIAGYYIYMNNKNNSGEKISNATSSESSSSSALNQTQSSSTGTVSSEATVSITSMNGSFSPGNILNIKDGAGKKWTVNYTDAILYYENQNMTPSIWPGDISFWISQNETALSTGKPVAGETSIKIIGNAGSDGILNALNIIQEVK